MSENINVFISYSWEEDLHQQWVKSLADKLLNDGINVILDQYDFELGDRLPYSMEQAIKQSDYVLIICTPTYKDKADSRISGVGYEGNIISGELYSEGNERKFVPIVRKENFQISMPDFLLGKMGVSLTEENDFDENYNNLLASLYGAKSKPAIGKTPSKFRKSEKPLPKSYNEEIEIIGIITNEVTLPKNDGSRGSALYRIPFRLNRAPDSTWNDLFVNSWDSPPRFTTMHRPGIASINNDKIILNGTTIDEVKDYHRDTLIICVKEANKKYKTLKDIQRNKEKRQQDFSDEHYNCIHDISDQIKF